MSESEKPTASATPINSDLIQIDDGKLNPESIEVKQNTLVTIENLDKTPHLVISDPHPAHDALPDLYSGELYQHNSYQYTFVKTGVFYFHLEDNPSIRGKIIVK